MILLVGIVDDGVACADLAAEGARAVVVGNGLAAFVVDVDRAPSLDLDALKTHDRRVRLAQAAPALLPVRYVDVHDDDKALITSLAPRLKVLRTSLERVRGKEQMTLRVAGAPQMPAADVVTDPQRPGTSFLAKKQAAQKVADVPALDPLRDALAEIVVEERVEKAAPPLLASVFHLIPRGQSQPYIDIVQAAAVDVRIKVSGPFPCWAFT